jgi:hypothetical protein
MPKRTCLIASIFKVSKGLTKSPAHGKSASRPGAAATIGGNPRYNSFVFIVFFPFGFVGWRLCRGHDGRNPHAGVEAIAAPENPTPWQDLYIERSRQ